MGTINEYNDRLNVSEEALAEIAAAAADESEGVSQGKSAAVVEYSDGALQICLSLYLEKGAKASACAEAVQEAVRDSIQNMTGITVSKVNVKVCGQI